MGVKDYAAPALKALFSFLGEVLFGDSQTSAEARQHNKMIVFLMAMLVVLFGFYYHNSFEFDRLIAANNSLDEKVVVVQSKLDAANLTIQILNLQRAQASSTLACPPQVDTKALQDQLTVCQSQGKHH